MNDEKKSFDYMWELLNPPREFHNMRAKCETVLWNALSIHMQHRVYRLIRDKKRRGESIQPNPWYAIVKWFFNQARKRRKYDFLEKFLPLEEH